jgi:phosphatidylglycerophosphate synthase
MPSATDKPGRTDVSGGVGARGAAVPLGRFASAGSGRQGPLWDWLIFERTGACLAWVFHRLRATPDVVTILGGLCGVVGAALLATAGERVEVLVAGVVLLLAYSLDCADGQLARATGRTSARGAWLDVAADATVTAFLVVALAVALSTDETASALAALLVAGAFGASRTVGLFTWTQVRSTKEPLQRSGALSLVKTAYGAAVQTPFVYAVLCATRLSPTAFRVAILVITVLTVGRTTVAVRRHFRESTVEATG